MASIVTQVVTQHTEEAAFQWLLRRDAVHAPHFSLSDLAYLDDIVAAHLDGLRIAGDPGWEICREEMSWQEPGELFTAAVLAYESGREDRIKLVTETAIKSDEAAPGLASALGWLTYAQAQRHISTLLQADEPILRRLGLAAAAIQRQDPGAALEAALQAIDLVVTPRALRAAGELGRQDLLPLCQAQLTADDDETKFWAAWAATLLGDKHAAETLTALSTDTGPRAEQACICAVRAMSPGQALQWQKELAADANHHRLATIAAGATGDPQLIPWLIEIMAEDEHARAAGEAFTFITGLDLAYLDLDRDKPEGFESGPTEDPADEDVAMDADEDLPWPDPELIAAWWAENKGRFDPGRRYLVGAPIEMLELQNVLRSGLQRQRAAAALEMVLLQPGQPLFEVRARGDRQRQILGAP
jgi:uncharacterized protein (TIGR02270 family)